MARPVKTKIGENYYCYDPDDWRWVDGKLVPASMVERFQNGSLSYEECLNAAPETQRLVVIHEAYATQKNPLLDELRFVEAPEGAHAARIQTPLPDQQLM